MIGRNVTPVQYLLTDFQIGATIILPENHRGGPMKLTEHERRKALGIWGERKALTLLRNANFANVRDLNAATLNHPFGDISAERGGIRYMIGVKTRNKFTAKGPLNPTYNIRK